MRVRGDPCSWGRGGHRSREGVGDTAPPPAKPLYEGPLAAPHTREREGRSARIGGSWGAGHPPQWLVLPARLKAGVAPGEGEGQGRGAPGPALSLTGNCGLSSGGGGGHLGRSREPEGLGRRRRSRVEHRVGSPVTAPLGQCP